MTALSEKDAQAWELACKRWNGQADVNAFVAPGCVQTLETSAGVIFIFHSAEEREKFLAPLRAGLKP